MEFVISSRDAPTGSIYEDETYCTRGLCSHPSCWGSHIRQTRGFRKYVSMSADPSTANRQPAEDDEESDDGLATQKVLNLLDEYGESPTDLYPSRFRGVPAHLRKQRGGVKEDPMKSVVPPHVPRSSPYNHNKQWQYDEVLEPSRRPANVNQVEVQEVFDLEELSQTWDNTFLTKPMYVWIPGKKGGKSKRTRKQKLRSSSHKHLSEPETVAPKDFAADVLPQQPHTSPAHPRQAPKAPTIPVSPPSLEFSGSGRVSSDSSLIRLIKNRSRSPTHLPTGGQPYHNVGQTPKDRLRYRMIMDELKDLPRPFVIEVMEKTRGMKNKEEILMLMERVLTMRDNGYLTTMRKSDWELSMVTGQVLRQRRLNKNMFEYYERMRYPAGEQVYKLDEESADELEEQDDQQDLSAVPDDVIADAICKTKYKPLPDIVKKKKKNTVRVHVATTTEESVKPFHYKKQQNMEFCLEKSASGNHIAGPNHNHLCKNYMLYQFANDYGLAEPNPSLAASYCDLVCENNGSINQVTPQTKPSYPSPAESRKPSEHYLPEADVLSPLRTKQPSISKKAHTTRSNVQSNESVFIKFEQKMIGAPFLTKLRLSGYDMPPPKEIKPTACQCYPREVSPTTLPHIYTLRPDEIPNLAKLPACGIHVEGGMKPFFGTQPLPVLSQASDSELRSFSSNLCSDFTLSPTRSLSSANFSRPQSQRTSLPSARDHANMAADMSVLYDQESVDRNLNNNNAEAFNKRDAVAGSRTSSVVVPKAPAGTPYTPTTPARERIPGENTTTGGAPITLPDGVVLEVIQETSAVDDFTARASKDKQSQERQIHSVLEGRVSASLDNRRVASAKLSRDIDDEGMKRRVQSANNISLAVVDSSSVAGQPDNQVTDMQGGQTARATTSRLDVVSTTSNWPNIDEEALLREQTTPKPEKQPARVLSAPDNETESRNISAKRPATQPVTKPHEKTKIVIDLPAPPPPSPEPSDKPRLSSFQDERQNDDTPKLDSQTPVNTAAVIDMSDLSDLPPAVQSPQVASEANQSAALPILPTNENTQLSHLTEQSTLSVEQGDSKEIKDELSQKLELVMNVDTGRDALSLVPDYKDMDMEREITLSALPPSALDTPDVTTPAHLRKPTNSEKCETTPLSTDKQSAPSSEQPLPTVAEVMRPDDEGGLAG